MFESHHQPLISKEEFILRLLKHTVIAVLILILSLLIGVLGYHFFENLSWIDALLNAAMILGGMGPVNILTTNAGKFFASFYALYSGVVFLVVVGVILAPILHRFLHRFHLDED